TVKVIGGESDEELSKMDPHEFARLIIVEKMGGIISPRKSGDLGIDGWVEFKTIPVQVKRWKHKVGRPEVDKFYRAIDRDHKKKGMIVAYDFSKDCYAEVAAIGKEHKIKIALIKVKDVFTNGFKHPL
ncbi:restriction endonuclease, partial [Candidatus Woesearchaeota archaeon]|nr:restriction endonuclease [Candidatus Woesearchaeota archaeon]